MYTPTRFATQRPFTEISGDRGFGLLITAGADELWTTHLPFVVSADSRVCLHMARANDHWREIEREPRCRFVIQGAHGYVSPNWYQTRDAVPTWNYEAVHLDAEAELIFDREALRALLRSSVARFEDATTQGPWSLDDVSEAFIGPRLNAIVGVRLRVVGAAVKQKLSQDRTPLERARVIDELKQRGNHALARAMEALAG